ncbi:MAG TPA: hypothetical protein VJ823_01335 [Rhodanobacteraceae bacterium]|nr:hypothetical protein [Rhodanobacteraceae bacterium]
MSTTKDDEVRKAYQRGYAAGRKRLPAEGEIQFWEQAFLSVSPYFAGCPAWHRGDVQLTSLEERAGLAAKWATAAIKHRRCQ